jgi:hypothetical protein
VGYSKIPRGARLLEENFGIDADGEAVSVAFWQHQPRGAAPVWLQSATRYAGRRAHCLGIEQFTGASGEARMREELAVSRRLLAESRDIFLRQLCQQS